MRFFGFPCFAMQYVEAVLVIGRSDAVFVINFSASVTVHTQPGSTMALQCLYARRRLRG